MSFIPIEQHDPPKYESFMAYSDSSGDIFVQYWVSNEFNNFMIDDTKFSHWQIIVSDNRVLNR